MTSKEIRQGFLDYFKSKEHRIVQSAPVIPHGDPTLLFTNAGMNQFKDVFLGSGKRDYRRAADTQKCIRVSGKHNDLEEVGVDTYHHTFFEMLGNWSFGDYYKAEAIEWAWELLTKVWKLPVERLHATVYRTDDEALELWKNYLPENRIHRFDEKDNFWEMGETGPCGPCSEIHYDRTPDLSGGKLVNAGVPEVIEIWNLVFIQYNRKIDGSLEDLTAKHVDTGMGFERICAVINNMNSNYDIDIFRNIISEIEKLSGRAYSQELTNPDGVAMRVIADHLRTLSFAVADGAIPGKEGRGYVLRRILRRASRFARNLGFREPVIYKLLPSLIESMGEVFPELVSQRAAIEKIIRGEEETFLQTLDRGIILFDSIISRNAGSGSKVITGEDAFQLYDTYGFPLDLTELMARENGYAVDSDGFSECMKVQKERSRSARKSIHQEVELPDMDFVTEFAGYETTETDSEVLFADENRVVVRRTPFYTESGGQIADTGYIVLAGERYEVTDVRKSGDAVVHFCDRDVEPLTGAVAHLQVDVARRKNIMRNHSATHLMHEALRQVLGGHVKQSGSLVSPDYLRFDFNHFEKLTYEEILKIEDIVNTKILEGIPVRTDVLPIEEAQKNSKVKMFFGDKYGDVVRVVTMDDKYSMEFCGGTHVANTCEIGLFRIVSESSIAAGVRRIEAVTGTGVRKYILDQAAKLSENSGTIAEMAERIRGLEKELSKQKINELKNSYSEWISKAAMAGDIRVVTRRIDADDMDQMRDMGENLRGILGEKGIGLLATVINEKAQLVCLVTDDLKGKLPAGKLVGEAAKVLGGGGGGKPHMATAGGKDVEKIGDLLKRFPEIVKGML